LLDGLPLRAAPAKTLLCATILAIGSASPSFVFAENGGWDFEPYRIRAVLAIDAPGGLTEHWSGELPAYLHRRVDSALAPGWIFDLQLATGAERLQVFKNIATTTVEKPTDFPRDYDKLMLLAVRWSPTGIELLAREYDQYVERWSVPIRRECRQASGLPEQLFAVACQAFSPQAKIEVDASNPLRVALKPRGGGLPRGTDLRPWAKAGDVYLPILRRTSRGGQVVENGIQAVPWTYIEAVEGKNKSLEFQVHSGSRRPFGAKRPGRVEVLAIGIRSDADTTTLRLHARKNDKKPLVGYEVLSQQAGQPEPTRIGLSDALGEVRVPPGKSRIEMLLIKHGGQLLGKLPVVPGAEQRVSVPLPDDDARLAAEARLAALREELIDVVARRNILMSRTRQKIEKKDFAAAQELLRTLDELPAKPQFNLTLSTAARLLRSDDPLMQRRIDQLFQATQTLMTQFLDLKPINELHNDLREAQQKNPPKTEKT
jgi:hypothetical protein